MDRSSRRTSAVVLLAAGCVFSASSHAYNAAEDADAQDREVKAAYDRGYKAAKEEYAREAATRQSASPNTANAPPATAAPTQKTSTPPVRKPILDIKHVYSDTSDVETVQEVPVTARPLPGQQSTQTPPATEAHAAPPQPAARRFTADAAEAADASAAPAPRQNQQPVRSADAQVRNSSTRPYTGRTAQYVTPPPQVADDEDEAGDEAVAPRAAQVYTTQPRYAPRPQPQYAPPPAAMRPAPQPYGYVQQPAYAAPRPYPYYSPPAPWVAQYQPAPQTGRWYWSPEYGRWLYY
ncbi:hypothetical protein J8I87_13315 [Paraburkholderia sp. LEh10]|uniref:hypothetical protein n=1 Tax=Paraburkholderia sp. LEh10 TaxID=2821353 RepID=UPI001AEB3659|nr:hypothetical protein [Paraburkholderia sp. LEh10]MBP0590679.1 hypothetical protein [Paraburkholderia sp. LEh10]